MTDFPKRPVTITLTGEQWVTLLARIVGSKPTPGLFSAEGARVYNETCGELQRQMLEEQRRSK